MEVKYIDGHSARVFSVIFVRNNSVLCSSAYDESIKFWCMKEGKLKKEIKMKCGSVFSVAVS